VIWVNAHRWRAPILYFLLAIAFAGSALASLFGNHGRDVGRVALDSGVLVLVSAWFKSYGVGTEVSGLVRDYGLLVVPLDLSKNEADLLIAELKTSGINRTTH
jgi:hypothetical protein